MVCFLAGCWLKAIIPSGGVLTHISGGDARFPLGNVVRSGFKNHDCLKLASQSRARHYRNGLIFESISYPQTPARGPDPAKHMNALSNPRPLGSVTAHALKAEVLKCSLRKGLENLNIGAGSVSHPFL